MSVIRHAESRRTETPSAVMTTLASPTQGGGEQPIWRVDVGPGQVGPAHVIDTQQIWTVLHGDVTVDLDGSTIDAGPGDTIVMPGAVPRQVSAGSANGFAAIVVGAAGARASLPDGTDRGVPPWML
ncbi:cupin domain-containing protein [Phytoactinopolyspora endophytica]|uniref:cupin domain-containing protein n=1 Tax=Phytoactinopolyspora endophytica TaxID=1642495 RepID=UPI00101E0E75|nr:cupin domain-containing protein [Phytoactinopolyspora endophytica]